MGSEDESASPSEPPEKRRTKKYVRRIGRAIFLGGGFLMFVLMLIGVVRGIQSDRAWDPYTGKPHREGRCLDEARELMLDAGRLESYAPRWDRRYVEWAKTCKEGHPGVHELLESTHTDLQRRRERSP